MGEQVYVTAVKNTNKSTKYNRSSQFGATVMFLSLVGITFLNLAIIIKFKRINFGSSNLFHSSVDNIQRFARQNSMSLH